MNDESSENESDVSSSEEYEQPPLLNIDQTQNPSQTNSECPPLNPSQFLYLPTSSPYFSSALMQTNAPSLSSLKTSIDSSNPPNLSACTPSSSPNPSHFCTDVMQIIQLHQQGYSFRQMEKLTGLSKTSLHRKLKKHFAKLGINFVTPKKPIKKKRGRKRRETNSFESITPPLLPTQNLSISSPSSLSTSNITTTQSLPSFFPHSSISPVLSSPTTTNSFSFNPNISSTTTTTISRSRIPHLIPSRTTTTTTTTTTTPSSYSSSPSSSDPRLTRSAENLPITTPPPSLPLSQSFNPYLYPYSYLSSPSFPPSTTFSSYPTHDTQGSFSYSATQTRDSQNFPQSDLSNNNETDSQEREVDTDIQKWIDFLKDGVEDK